MQQESDREWEEKKKKKMKGDTKTGKGMVGRSYSYLVPRCFVEFIHGATDGAKFIRGHATDLEDGVE